METKEIDLATAAFMPRYALKIKLVLTHKRLDLLFYQDGILVNNSFKAPITFTADSFIQALEALVAAGNMDQFMQREVWAKTDVFGKVGQRFSVYEYSFADHEMEHLPRGINYIQFIQVEGLWKITSMVWADENEDHLIPKEYWPG